MRSKVFFLLAFALVVFCGYKTVQDKMAMSTLLSSAIYFALSMVFYWFGVRSKFHEDHAAKEKEWEAEREKEDKNLETVRSQLLQDGYELRSKRRLVNQDTEDGEQVIKLTTEDGVEEKYPCSELVSDPVPESKWCVYKNEIVAFVFFETVKTSGFYFVKVR